MLEDVLSNPLLAQEGIQFTMFAVDKGGWYSAFLHLMRNLMLLRASSIIRVLAGVSPQVAQAGAMSASCLPEVTPASHGGAAGGHKKFKNQDLCASTWH